MHTDCDAASDRAALAAVATVTEPKPLWDGGLRVPDGASAHRVRTPDGSFDAVLVLFAPADTERLHAAAQRSDDARVLEYLRTRRPETLCATDPDDPSVDAMLRDMAISVYTPSVREGFCMSPEPSGVRSLVAGCAPLAALITARGGGLGGHGPPGAFYDAALAYLPDGRVLCVPGAYDVERHVLGGLRPGPRHWVRDGRRLPMLSAAWGWSFVALGEDADEDRRRELMHTLEEFRASLAAAAAVAAHGAVHLAGMVPPPVRSLVLRLLRGHVLRLAARRRAATAIARAWCRYDGAPHGPRARYLRDLEHGWTPGTRHAAAPAARPDDRAPDEAPAANSAEDKPFAWAELFASDAAYRAYSDYRLHALRRHLPAAVDATDRLRMRRSALCELCRRDTDAQRAATAP